MTPGKDPALLKEAPHTEIKEAPLEARTRADVKEAHST